MSLDPGLAVGEASAPLAEAGGWLDALGKAGTAEALRRHLSERYPSLCDGHPKAIAILGAAEEGERLASICNTAGIDVVAVVDDSPHPQGRTLGRQRVEPSSRLAAIDRSVPVVICSHRLLGATTRLADEGFSTAPFAALQLIRPSLFPPHAFYDGLLEDLVDNRDRYRRLGDQLADDKSRRVLQAVLGFRMTLDARLLEPVLDDDLYGADCLPPFAADEVYIDGGSYDGDTIRSFIKRVDGRFERIYGFEPDPRTFKRLQQNFADEPRVTPVPKGLYSKRTVLRFADAESRASLLTPAGAIEVPVTSLDEELADRRVTYIKMNIEGAELEAITGAQRTIRSHAPKLAISAYHRPSHLWEVPASVMAMRPDYRLFLRQHDGGIIETVLYAVAG